MAWSLLSGRCPSDREGRLFCGWAFISSVLTTTGSILRSSDRLPSCRITVPLRVFLKLSDRFDTLVPSDLAGDVTDTLVSCDFAVSTVVTEGQELILVSRSFDCDPSVLSILPCACRLESERLFCCGVVLLLSSLIPIVSIRRSRRAGRLIGDAELLPGSDCTCLTSTVRLCLTCVFLSTVLGGEA